MGLKTFGGGGRFTKNPYREGDCPKRLGQFADLRGWWLSKKERGGGVFERGGGGLIT